MTAFLPSAESGSDFASADRLELAYLRPKYVHVESARQPTFRFDQRFFPLDDGRTLLRLLKPLQVIPDKTGMLEVVNWGIRLRVTEADEIPRQVARKFILCFSRAKQNKLSDAEKMEWLTICDQVDVAQFNIDWSPPHYMEGILKAKSPTTVEWHDGTIESLSSAFGSSFFALDQGDRFSAFVKVGFENKTQSIERINILQ